MKLNFTAAFNPVSLDYMNGNKWQHNCDVKLMIFEKKVTLVKVSFPYRSSYKRFPQKYFYFSSSVGQLLMDL